MMWTATSLSSSVSRPRRMEPSGPSPTLPESSKRLTESGGAFGGRLMAMAASRVGCPEPAQEIGEGEQTNYAMRNGLSQSVAVTSSSVPRRKSFPTQIGATRTGCGHFAVGLPMDSRACQAFGSVSRRFRMDPRRLRGGYDHSDGQLLAMGNYSWESA